MARMHDNNATHGISGKVNQFVYRQRFGETVVSKPPIRTAPLSAAQKNINSTFKQAVLFARSILQDAAIKLAYKKKAKRGASAFNLAIADFFKAPEILAVDFSELTNQVGSKISAIVIDNFRVEAVKVKITKANGTLVEEGDATLLANGLTWEYLTTTAGANTSGNKVSISASDLPGNMIVELKTM